MSIDSILSHYPILNFVCFLQINISVQWFSVQPFLIFCLIHLLNLHFLISKISFLEIKITFLEILFDSFPIFLFFLGNLIAASYATLGLPGGSDGKESACNVGDLGSIPGLGRSPGGGHGNPLQNSCLENPMDRGAWQATVHGVAKSRTPLSD